MVTRIPDTAGVIGLGEMGTPIVRHWLDEGFDVVAFDIDDEKVDRAAQLGADTADSPAELGAKADVILIVAGGRRSRGRTDRPRTRNRGPRDDHLLWAAHTANYDALRLAQAFGVDTDKLREGLKQSSGNNYALHRWEKATGKWAEDDLRIVFEMADEYDVDMPQTERTRDAMDVLEMEDIWTLRDVDYRDANERKKQDN